MTSGAVGCAPTRAPSELEGLKEAVRELAAKLDFLLALRAPPEARGLTLEQAAERLSCSPRHLSRMVRSGKISVVQVGTLRRIPVSEIERVLTPPIPALVHNNVSRPRRAPMKHSYSARAEAEKARALVRRSVQ